MDDNMINEKSNLIKEYCSYLIDERKTLNISPFVKYLENLLSNKTIDELINFKLTDVMKDTKQIRKKEKDYWTLGRHREVYKFLNTKREEKYTEAEMYEMLHLCFKLEYYNNKVVYKNYGRIEFEQLENLDNYYDYKKFIIAI